MYDEFDEQREFNEEQRQQAEANLEAFVDEWCTHEGDDPEDGKVEALAFNSVIARGPAVVFVFTSADLERDQHLTNVWRMASEIGPEGVTSQMVCFDVITHSNPMQPEEWYTSCREWLDQQEQVDPRYEPVSMDKRKVLYGV